MPQAKGPPTYGQSLYPSTETLNTTAFNTPANSTSTNWADTPTSPELLEHDYSWRIETPDNNSIAIMHISVLPSLLHKDKRKLLYRNILNPEETNMHWMEHHKNDKNQKTTYTTKGRYHTRKRRNVVRPKYSTQAAKQNKSTNKQKKNLET